jgi:hypothetical protein
MAPSRPDPPKIPQISVSVPSKMKAALVNYADELGVDISAIVNLLILREKRLGRLAALSRMGTPPKRPRQLRGKAVPMEHVTVYFGSLRRTAEFGNYARSCGLKRTDALAWLIKSEIKEMWLRRALSMQ